MKRRAELGALGAALLFSAAPSAPALGPHEIALLVNETSPRSVELANHYAAWNGVPPQNVIRLRPPPESLRPEAAIGREAFLETIWKPAEAAVRARGLASHVLAWVYSADFPTRIAGAPDLSLHGSTLLRGNAPDAALVTQGRLANPLFAGPGPDLKGRNPPQSLEQFTLRLGTNMPLPSMTLAHFGARGETLDMALARLKASAALRGRPPAGPVYFLLRDDVRSTCRSWQYADAAGELLRLGVEAYVTSNLPPGTPAAGLMTGQQYLQPAGMPALSPGTLADHLTSYAGSFAYPDQSKLSVWLRAGAAAAAGTVTEPKAIWTKFPHARLFAHYAAGCSVLEAYYQATASPFQLLIVGDPLLAPWSTPPGLALVRVDGEADTPARGPVEFATATWGSDPSATRILFLLDGRPLAGTAQTRCRIDTTALDDGHHELRAVVYAGGAVQHQSYATAGFVVNNRGRSLALDLAAGAQLDVQHRTAVSLRVGEPPAAVALWRNGERLDEQAFTTNHTYALDPALLGSGPVRLQLAARFADGTHALSAPVDIHIARPTPSPRPEGTVRLADLRLEGGTAVASNGVLILQALTNLVLARVPESAGSTATVLAVELRIPKAEDALPGQWAGLIFQYRDASNFAYFGWHGGSSGWSLSRLENGRWREHTARGAFLEAAPWTTLRLDAQGSGVDAWVNGERMGRIEGSLQGAWGLLAGTEPAAFRHLSTSGETGNPQ